MGQAARGTAAGATLSLLFLRLPRRVAAPVGAGGFWFALLLVALLTASDDWALSEAPRSFDPDGVRGLAFQALLALGAGGLLARMGAGRPRLLWLTAAIALLAPVVSEFLLRPVEHVLLPLLVDWPDDALTSFTDGLWVLWVAACFWRLLAWLNRRRAVWLRVVAALLATALTIAPRYYVPLGHVIDTQAEESDDADEGTDPEPEAEPEFDPETVMRSQDRLLDDALARLAPQRPGQVDLYLVSFGGDGSEDVFRNEAEYADKLFRERFDGEGRTLVLLNHPDTTARIPLATPGNLERALEALGRVADPEQDIVAVYLASHGSPAHEILVNLPPLPLRQLKPEALRSALDRCGIRHRVVMISACYAGGFVPALKSPETMVLTAARADRPSFGCGSDSDITYFGRALLVDALNRTTSLNQAFGIAEREIATWEAARHEEHSHPQFVSTPDIEAQLARWQAGVRLGLPVAFHTATEEPHPLQ